MNILDYKNICSNILIRETSYLALGVRKLRWSVPGKGTRGGIRVIYYWKKQDDEIWMLTVYGKTERSTVPNHIIKKIAEEIKNA
jgi:hypothetical protein